MSETGQGTKSRASGSDRSGVIDWLLERDQPSVRYSTLVDLLDRPLDDPEVRVAKSNLVRRGWAADLLRSLHDSGLWEAREPRTLKEFVDFLYYPKYGSSNWKAIVLAELGVTSAHPKVRKLAEQFFGYKLRLSSPFNYFHEEVCAAGNTARLMTRFGYGEDRRIRMLFDWLVEDQRENGGWN